VALEGVGGDESTRAVGAIARLKKVWVDEQKRWNERDLSTKRYVYMWADGIHVLARLEDDAQCILVIIGATPEGKKEHQLIGHFSRGIKLPHSSDGSALKIHSSAPY
jgi:hypothetical protein